jgi:hypothetical protein
VASGGQVESVSAPHLAAVAPEATEGEVARERKVVRARGALRLVLVRWHDAWFDLDLPAGGWRDDYVVQTVGYVVRETDTTLSVAQERLPHGDGFRAVTHIPRGTIETVTTLFEDGGPARRAGDRALRRDG